MNASKIISKGKMGFMVCLGIYLGIGLMMGSFVSVQRFEEDCTIGHPRGKMEFLRREAMPLLFWVFTWPFIIYVLFTST